MLPSCAGSLPPPPVEIATTIKCPPLSTDLTAEVRRKTRIKGESAFEIAANLVSQARRKNAALKRALAAYQACRNT